MLARLRQSQRTTSVPNPREARDRIMQISEYGIPINLDKVAIGERKVAIGGASTGALVSASHCPSRQTAPLHWLHSPRVLHAWQSLGHATQSVPVHEHPVHALQAEASSVWARHMHLGTSQQPDLSLLTPGAGTSPRGHAYDPYGPVVDTLLAHGLHFPGPSKPWP
mmetsp:Transcript_5237/g.10042  ORF Transcript_5237/g.10042 Transcript_5237/m.10042 type:complete len:166 (-) Transcript_5237:98-595(-)